jgi:hypothetical protein
MAKKKMGRPPTHGARSVSVATRYDDKRTGQGRALHEAITSLVDHCADLKLEKLH